MTLERDLIKYYRSLGLEIHTSTKARGHQGFYVKNRIDISKNIAQERIVPTLLHEFAHYIHSKLEPKIYSNGGTLEVIFDLSSPSEIYEDELFEVTKLVDKHAKFELLNNHKQTVKRKLLYCENVIKQKYPNFLRSKKFKEFDKYIKKSEAKYLLKYDRVKLITGWLFKKTKILSVENIEQDFKDMPSEFCAYIKLKSCQRRQARISGKINRLRKYYSKPTELFARFVEGLYLYPQQVKLTAPHVYNRFYELLNSGYYMELSKVFQILQTHNSVK